MSIVWLAILVVAGLAAVYGLMMLAAASDLLFPPRGADPK